MSQITIGEPIHLPTATLRRSLEATVGADAAASALQRAGYDAGDTIFESLEAPGNALASLDESQFWAHLQQLASGVGWGSLQFEEVHAGLGALTSSDWAEADPGAGVVRPSCHFTTGLFANLFGRIADLEVGVLEVECRSQGDLQCRFLFGGRDALEGVYTNLRAGTSLEEAVARLG